MKIAKTGVSGVICIGLIYFLNNAWNFGSPIPPLGKFLDPFHGFWQNAETKDVANHEISVPGLKGKVTIVYDSALIPHVFAMNNTDLFLAQGYVTAQHRLWQMEFQTHAAAGRISEIAGEAALDFDRSQRRIGMVLGAQNSLKMIDADPEIKEAVGSYTAGVNAYINQLNYEGLPIEYKLMGYRPEPWTELKVGLFLMNMAKTLNSGENDLELTNALNVFGKETLDLLFPDREPVSDPVVDNQGGWKFRPVTLDSISLAIPIPPEIVSIAPLEKQPKGIGSNNWAVSGKKTVSGSPILCSDPHLGLTMPSIWYAIHLNAPGINVMGSSFPGAPCVIIGFNDSIAWGPTNAQRDLVDWYKITFKDNTKNEYLSDGQWKPSRKVIEKFAINGKPDFYDTIVYTHHGPVTYDESYHGDQQNKHYAYRWIAHDGGNILRTFFEFDGGKNHADYMAALDHYYFPAQNFAFASVSGDIAIRVQGKYPVRRKDEGKFVLDGSKTSTEWKAFIPFDQNVMIKNPERGFISSANQYPVDSSYPYYVHSSQWEYYRNRRINRVLSELTDITPQKMMKLQNDNYNIQAEEYLPLLLDAMKTFTLTNEEKEIMELMTKWDFVNDAVGTAPSYFESWVEEIQTAIWDEMSDSKTSMPRPSEYMTWWLLKNNPDLSFYDDQKTPEKESRNDIIKIALQKANERISKWEKANERKADWAYFKDSYVRHLLRLAPFSIHAINGGNSNTLNASRGGWGPSWRMIVSLEKSGVKAWGVYPGGQSGNPGSPFYNNFIEPWEKAQPLPLKFVGSESELSASTFFTTTLTPASK
jgi:penicillin amidase